MGITPDTHLSISIVRKPVAFEAMHAEWDALVRESAVQGPFLSWGWLFTWWETFGRPFGLRLLVVRHDARLVAVAPLCLAHGPLGLRRLQFLGTGTAGSDYLDVIVRRGYESPVIEALTGALNAIGAALRLTRLPANAIAARVAQQLEGRAWICRTREDGNCPVIRLEGHTLESYLGTRGPAHRANVRHRMREAARLFTVRFERAVDAPARTEALNALASFHRQRWAGRSTAFASPAMARFHAASTAATDASRHLRLFTMRFDGELAGVMYAFSQGRHFYFYQHGFDARFSGHSPGLVLMARTIQAALEEGATDLDLLWGTEPYKALWADESNPLTAVTAFPAGRAGRLHAWLDGVQAAVRPAARRLRARVAHVT